MYVILFICVITSLASPIREDSYVIRLSPKFLNNVQHIIEKCVKESKATPNAFKNMLEGHTEDDATIAFMYCYLPEVGFLNKDGHLEVKTLVDLLKKEDLKEKFAGILEECNKPKNDNPLETLRLVSDCFYKNSPVTFALNDK